MTMRRPFLLIKNILLYKLILLPWGQTSGISDDKSNIPTADSGDQFSQKVPILSSKEAEEQQRHR